MMDDTSRRASTVGGGATASPEMASIKVYCRLRQQNQLEKREGALPCSTVLDGRTMFLRTDKCDVDEIRCTFDRVFDTQSTQQEVYEHTAKPLVHEFLQGYNCTIFAYGQTGSGKTHTILGPKDGVVGKPEDEGIISRVVRDLFRSVEATTAASKDTKIELTASFVEIYMEQIRDLLTTPGTTMPVGGLKIRENAQRGVYIEEMNQVTCHTEAAMLDIVKTGTLNRSVSSTRMNKDSSRSHCILMIGATRKELRGTVVKKATMYVVDLAGSEFVNKTNASGKVLQEAKAINKSLSALSNVIKALVEGKKHVPYRDSKLTRLLQDSLGGTAKTCLILAASCSSYNMPETISTLRFGLRAKEIKNPVALKHSDGGISAGGIFKELYQQAMEDIEEKNKKIDELQHLLAQAYEASAASAAAAMENAPDEGELPGEEGRLGGDDTETEEQVWEDGAVHGPDEERFDQEYDDCEPRDEGQLRDEEEDQANFMVELELSNQRLRDENGRLFNVLEALDSQLDQILIKTTASGRPCLSLKSTDDEKQGEHAVTLKMWLQSESWRQLTAISALEIDEPVLTSTASVPGPSECAETSQTSTPAGEISGPAALESTAASAKPSGCSASGGDNSPICVHRVDSEALSRQIVELKLQLHYLTESTKQSLDGEQYIIVLENAKLKTRIEELEFQANLSNVRCNQLEMKNRAWETRLSNQETHIACLQNSLQEYQGLFKQQIIMSQEKCRLLSDELEFYKKISKHTSGFPSQEGSDHGGHGSPSPTRSYSMPRSPSPQKGSVSRSANSPRARSGSVTSSLSPFSRLKSLGNFYRPLVVESEPPANGSTTPLTVKAQRMIVKPESATVPNQSPATTTNRSLSPWRRKGFDLSFTGSHSPRKALTTRTASSPELRAKLLLEDVLFGDTD